MKALKILSYGDPRLLQKTQEVKEVDQCLVDLVQQMFDTLYVVPGIGIAAPQVGCSLRFFVFDLNRRAEAGNRTPVTLINPVVTDQEGIATEDEGCLSFPGIFVPVERASRIEIKGMDLNGKEIVLEGEGLFARLIQHEMDHLEGVLLSERMTKWDRIRLGGEIKKIERTGRRGNV
ncbi:MAG: peptide deformylase [Leptospirales bacterium]